MTFSLSERSCRAEMDDTRAAGRGHDEAQTSLRLANGPLAAPVLCRVVSMVLARAEARLNRLDDAMLVCDRSRRTRPPIRPTDT